MHSGALKPGSARPGRTALRTTLRPGESDGILYVLRNRPEKVTRALRYITGLRARLVRRQILMFVLWLAFVAGLYLFGRWFSIRNPQLYGAWISMSITAGAVFLFTFALSKLVSASRAVNAPGRRSYVMILGAPAAVVLGLIVGGIWGGTLDDSGLELIDRIEAAREQFGFMTSPRDAARLLGLTALSLIAVLGPFLIRRLRLVTPDKAEVIFCSEIVGWLLADLPPDGKCFVELRPFPALWTAETRSVQFREGHFDCLLRFDCELAGGDRLRVVAMHRRTQKGRRKHKGWKQKVKTKIIYDLAPESGRRLPIGAFHHAARESLPKVKSGGRIGGGWAEVKPGGFATDEKGLRTSVTIQTGAVRLMKDISAADLPNPHGVLAVIQALSAAVR